MKKVKAATGGVKSTANETLAKKIDDIYERPKRKPLTNKDESVRLTFTITQDQYDQYESWYKEQNKKAVKIQKKKVKNPGVEHTMSWEMGYPYCGAIGGEISWIFSPTGLGDCCVVKHAVTGEELNITDYESW